MESHWKCSSQGWKQWYTVCKSYKSEDSWSHSIKLSKVNTFGDHSQFIILQLTILTILVTKTKFQASDVHAAHATQYAAHAT